MDGGIFGLLGLIAVHRGAVEYDLRQRFQLGLRDVGRTITLTELARLVATLRRDPSSAIAAALEGWDFPIDRTTLAIYDLFDVTVMANSDTKKGKPKPHSGRPFKLEASKAQERRGTAVPVAEAAAILNRYGHSLPV